MRNNKKILIFLVFVFITFLSITLISYNDNGYTVNADGELVPIDDPYLPIVNPLLPEEYVYDAEYVDWPFAEYEGYNPYIQYNQYNQYNQLNSVIVENTNIVFNVQNLSEQNKNANKLKENAKSFNKACDLSINVMNTMQMTFNSPKIGEDVRTSKIVNSWIDTIAGIAACCGPYGMIAAGVLKVGQALFNIANGGQEAASQEQVLKAELMAEFEGVKSDVATVSNQINEVSKSLTENSNKIIEKIGQEFDENDAKRTYNEFLYARTGNFSYNELKECMFGERYKLKAYYAKLQDSIVNGASEEIIKNYYELLYYELISNIGMFYEYISPTDGINSTKPIIECYYDILKLGNGLSDSEALYYTMQFANDLYYTAAQMEYLIAMCNFYFSTEILKKYEKSNMPYIPGQNDSSFEYDCGYTNDLISFQTIKDNEINSEERLNKLNKQTIKSIGKLHGLTSAYIVNNKHAGETNYLYEVTNNNPKTFGWVKNNDIVYLNSLPNEVIDSFGLSINDIQYVLYKNNDVNGVTIPAWFRVENDASSYTVHIKYKEEDIGDISFKVGDNPTCFNGGSGTETDPYLISSEDQLFMINDDLEAHYRLINDINIENVHNPIGYVYTGTEELIIKKFNGSLNGNNYSINGLQITHIMNGKQGVNVGLFASIDSGGVVTNLNVKNALINIRETTDNQSINKFYVGVLAGTSKGVIERCNLIQEYEEGKSIISEVDKLYKELNETFLLLYEKDDNFKQYIYGVYESYFSASDYYFNVDEHKEVLNYTYAKEISNEKAFENNMNEALNRYIKKYAETNGATILYNLNSTALNTNLVNYIGGLVGENYGIINCSTIKNCSIIGDSNNNIGGNAANVNQNEIYVGGICGANRGKIYLSISIGNLVYGHINFIHNNSDRISPYLTVNVGGICGLLTSTLDNVENIYSGSNNCKTWINANNNVKIKTKKAHIDKGTITDYCGNLTEDENMKLWGISRDINYYINRQQTPASFIEGEYLISNIKNGSIPCDNNVNVIDYKNIELLINGNKYSLFEKTKKLGKYDNAYKVINVYGMKTNNATTSINNNTCMLLAMANNNGVTFPVLVKLNLAVDEDYITEIDVVTDDASGFKTLYEAGESIMDIGFSIKKKWNTKGEITEEVNADSGVIITGVNEDLATMTSSVGIKLVNIRWDKFEVEEQITVTCDCENALIYEDNEKFEYLQEKSQEQTCMQIGFDVYKCVDCGREYTTNVTELGEHVHNHTESTESTCCVEGHTSKEYCSVCGKVFIEEEKTTVKPHKWEKYNKYQHICYEDGTVEGHIDNHTFELTKYVENGKVVYYYECSECHYFYTFIDENTNVIDKNEPIAYVTNGYALNPGDEVTVYIQIYNNPGISSANFGVRYDNRLEFVSYEEGNFKKAGDASFNFKLKSGNGYNFAWVLLNENIEKNLTILSMKFKLPSNATMKDEYYVKVVYNTIDDRVGQKTGFIVGDNLINPTIERFATIDGFIRLVNHLPGDANGDEKVDIEDVLLLGKYVNTPTSDLSEAFDGNDEEIDFIKKYCNVDLKDSIDIDDLSRLFRNAYGVVGGNLYSPVFRVKLYVDTDKTKYEDYWIDLNGDEENSFAHTTYEELPDISSSKYGYTFIRWSDSYDGGNTITLDEKVVFNGTMSTQTIYAKWNANCIKFDMNGAGVTKSDVYYIPEEDGENKIYLLDNSVEKEFTAIFRDNNYNLGEFAGDIFDDIEVPLIYKVCGWTCGDAMFTNSIPWNSELFANSETPGTITLKLEWGNASLDIPNITWEKEGFEISCWLFYDCIDQDVRSFTEFESVPMRYIVDGELVLNTEWWPKTYNITYLMNSHGHINGLYNQNDMTFYNGNTTNVIGGYIYETDLLYFYNNEILDLSHGVVDNSNISMPLTAVLQKDDKYVYFEAFDAEGNKVSNVSLRLYDPYSGSQINISFDDEPCIQFDNLITNDDEYVEYYIQIINGTGECIYVPEFWFGDGTLSGPNVNKTNIKDGFASSLPKCVLTNNPEYNPPIKTNFFNDIPADLYRNFLGFYVKSNGEEIMIYNEKCNLTDAGKEFKINRDITLYAKWENRRFEFALNDEYSMNDCIFFTINDAYADISDEFEYKDGELLEFEIIVYDEYGDNMTGHTGLQLIPRDFLFAALGYIVEIIPTWAD